MKKYVLLLACILGSGSIWAQSLPKWAEKAKKAVFSVITYGQDNKILNTGNGFYIDENGTAVSDYSLFKNAHHAVVVTADGKELPVTLILGANDIYDVIKFQTEVPKKMTAILPSASTPQKGETVYVLPYSTQKAANGRTGTISNLDSIANNSFYYTINMKTGDKIVSCPLMNTQGEVVGLIQKNSDSASEQSYALGIGFAKSLSINAMSGSDSNLNAIGIKKGLPDDESQALVMLYMMSNETQSEVYFERLNDFIAKFPNSSEGYLRRATYYISTEDETKIKLVEADFKQTIKVNPKADDAHYNIARLLYNYNLGLNGKEPLSDWTLDRALNEVNEALKISQEGLYYQIQGDILFAQKKYTEAAQSYSNLNKTKLVSAASLYAEAKAKELIEGTNKKELIALLDSAIAFYNPPYGQDAAPYLYERGRLRSEANDHRGAVKDFNAFHEATLGQVTANFYSIRADEELKCHMNQQALDDITKAIEMEPKDVELWAQKSGILIRLNQMQEAEKTLKHAISLNPNDAALYRMLGFSQINLKKKKEGLENLKKAKGMGDKIAEKLIEKYK